LLTYAFYTSSRQRSVPGRAIAQLPCSMDIRFISSLTPEDESAFAPALLKAVGALLDQLPIAYTLRIETTGAQVFQHTHPAFESATIPTNRLREMKKRLGNTV
jgi:hypothetical protein